jgi:benzylsuccinate CoA-transferase BbsF subunit
MQSKALEGVKVLDFTWVAAGPLAIRYLAQSGATIVKVGSAKRRGGTSGFSVNKDAQGPRVSLETNKFNIAINLNNPKGIMVAKRLVAWADVVAENFRPGVMEKWGLGYEDLRSINPSIIMFRTCAEGQTGPDAGQPALGTTLQSVSGFTFLTGWPDRDPSPPWGAYTDLIAPPFGAAMLIAALDYRARTGKGQCLDLAQSEASMHLLTPAILDYTVNGRSATRIGNSCPYAAPHGAYHCAGDDRWCTIAVFNDEEWRAFCKAIGEPKWTNETRFATVVERKKNEADLNKLIERWTINLTAEEVMILLQEHGISAGIAENAADLVQDPQMKVSGFIKRDIASKLSRTPYDLSCPDPQIGENTEYVCLYLLDMSIEELAELTNAGALD